MGVDLITNTGLLQRNYPNEYRLSSDCASLLTVIGNALRFPAHFCSNGEVREQCRALFCARKKVAQPLVAIPYPSNSLTDSNGGKQYFLFEAGPECAPVAPLLGTPGKPVVLRTAHLPPNVRLVVGGPQTQQSWPSAAGRQTQQKGRRWQNHGRVGGVLVWWTPPGDGGKPNTADAFAKSWARLLCRLPWPIGRRWVEVGGELMKPMMFQRWLLQWRRGRHRPGATLRGTVRAKAGTAKTAREQGNRRRWQ